MGRAAPFSIALCPIEFYLSADSTCRQSLRIPHVFAASHATTTLIIDILAWSKSHARGDDIDGSLPHNLVVASDHGIFGADSFVDPNLTCLPGPATTWWEQSDSSTVYSIGPTIICPQAYTTATTSLHGSSTFVACCPSNYELNTVADHGAAVQCQSHMSSGEEVTIVDYKTFTNNGELDSAWVTAVSTASGNVVVDGIQMNGWIFATSTSSSSSSPTGSSQTSASAGSSSTSGAPPANTSGLDTSNAAPQQKQSSSGLSVGAKAGIAVACALVGLAIIAAAVWYFLRRRRSAGAGVPPDGSNTLDGVKGYQAVPPPVQELHAPPWRTELMVNGGHQDRAELAADRA